MIEVECPKCQTDVNVPFEYNTCGKCQNCGNKYETTIERDEVGDMETLITCWQSDGKESWEAYLIESDWLANEEQGNKECCQSANGYSQFMSFNRALNARKLRDEHSSHLY